METISFTRESLYHFIYSERFDELINVPINKHRAISQINNPRADKDDVLLVAQFDENRTVGYLGILPDYIFIGENKEKVGWLTCFWVDDKYKSHNIAANLFLRSMRAYNKKIFITNIVPWLEPVYQKTKLFFPTKYKIGFRGYLRFNLSEILSSKNTFFKKITPLLKVCDFLLNSVADLRLLFYLKDILKEVRYDYVVSLDEIPDDFIKIHNTKSWNKREKKELNWIIQNPWLIEGIEKDKRTSRYYFSYLNRQFFTQIIKFSNNSNNLVGLIIINIRNNNLTVPYIFCNKDNYNLVAKFIVYTMINLKLNMFTTFHEDFSVYFNQINVPFLFKKSIKKPYFISKMFEDVKNLNFQDGDGDCAFY